MLTLARRNGRLFLEDVDLASVAAQHGTPSYVYSRQAIETAWRAFDAAFQSQQHLICYAVKANSSLAVLNCLARLGSGFDIVSGGELERVLRAGGDPGKVVFSGVGKTAAEMRQALQAGILCFNVESEAELQRLNAVAGELGVKAPVSLRVNPDVDAQTHPYISTGLRDNKFGIEIEQAEQIFFKASDFGHVEFIGVDCHIGSQLTSLGPIGDALERMLALADRLIAAGIGLTHINIGGGIGIRYNDEQPPTAAEYAAVVLERLGQRQLTLVMEPGRAIVGNAGVLLTTVEYLKQNPHKNFAVVDAGMNDLLRPALYDAWQGIEPVVENPAATAAVYDVVGPVCESADFLGKDRELAIAAGDLLAVLSAGAYGFVMSSSYNSRPRAAELMVDGEAIHVIRQRESYDDLLRGETLLPA